VVEDVGVGQFRVERVDDLLGFFLLEAKFVLLDTVCRLADGL